MPPTLGGGEAALGVGVGVFSPGVGQAGGGLRGGGGGGLGWPPVRWPGCLRLGFCHHSFRCVSPIVPRRPLCAAQRAPENRGPFQMNETP